jgi:hypothetical protein
MKTKTLFRQYPNGEILALFPEIPADRYGHYCMSYQLIGEHGAASPEQPNTVPASPSAYTDTLTALERRGYEIEPVKRISQAMHANRRAKAHAIELTASTGTEHCVNT